MESNVRVNIAISLMSSVTVGRLHLYIFIPTYNDRSELYCVTACCDEFTQYVNYFRAISTVAEKFRHYLINILDNVHKTVLSGLIFLCFMGV